MVIDGFVGACAERNRGDTSIRTHVEDRSVEESVFRAIPTVDHADISYTSGLIDGGSRPIRGLEVVLAALDLSIFIVERSGVESGFASGSEFLEVLRDDNGSLLRVCLVDGADELERFFFR